MGEPIKYTKGSVFKGRGHWRGKLVRVTGEGDDQTRQTLTATLTDEGGEPIRCFASGTRNKDAAKGALEAWRNKLIDGDRRAEERAMREAEEAARPKERRFEVAEYVAEFINHKATMYDPENRGADDIEPSTAYTYRKLNERIAAGFAGVTLEELTRIDVKSWIDGMKRDGVSPSMIRKSLVLLKSACKEAVIDGIIAEDPCYGVKSPKVPPREKNTLDEPTVAMLNAMLDKQGHTKMADAARIALHTGMRVGEICGLRWEDVDLRGGTITVKSAIGYNTGKGYVKSTKTGKIRTIPIDEDLRRMLIERCRMVEETCREMGVMFSKRLFVVGDVAAPQDVDGSHTNPGSISKLWGDFAKATGLRGVTGVRPTFHDLRHTYATIAVKHHNDIESVAAILGHRDVSMTLNTYATAMPEAVKQTVECMGPIMGRRLEPNKVLEIPATGTDGRE